MSNSIDSTALLSQLRVMADKAGIPPIIDGGDTKTNTVKGAEFTDLLTNTLQSVNNRKQTATKLAEAFELGDPNVDLSRVTIEIQKARIAFEALSQVRNKVISAYQEIMNMPV